MSRARPLLVVLCAIFALGACKVETTVHIEVDSNGSGTVTVTAIADAEVVERAPDLVDDLRFEDALAAGWQLTGPTATDEGGIQVSLQHDFTSVAEATALLQSINGSGGPLHDIAITQTSTAEGLTTSLAGVLRVDGELQAFADSDMIAAIGGSPYAAAIFDEGLRPTDAVTFTLTADLPGNADAVAIVDSSKLSWTVPIDGTAADLATTSLLAAGDSGSWGTVSTIALMAMLGWCLLAIAFIVFVARARRKRAAFRVRPLTRR